MNIDCRNSDIQQNSSNIENIILETIRNCVKPPTYQLTIHKIKQFIFDKLGISVNKQKLMLIWKISWTIVSKMICRIDDSEIE